MRAKKKNALKITKRLLATAATVIHFTQQYHGTARRCIADSWFESVKCASGLLRRGSTVSCW